jgi:hypothetical protein
MALEYIQDWQFPFRRCHHEAEGHQGLIDIGLMLSDRWFV